MLAALLRALFFAILSSPRGAGTISLPFYRRRAARKQYLCRFIVTAQRGNNICAVLSSPCSAGTIFCRFIVAVQRGNNICAILSSPRGAGTILLPFYRRRAARKQYLCRFIVAVRRGNNICAVLSSPRGAGTIFSRFSACSVTASNNFFVFTFSEWRHVLEW